MLQNLESPPPPPQIYTKIVTFKLIISEKKKKMMKRKELSFWKNIHFIYKMNNFTGNDLVTTTSENNCLNLFHT